MAAAFPADRAPQAAPLHHARWADQQPLRPARRVVPSHSDGRCAAL